MHSCSHLARYQGVFALLLLLTVGAYAGPGDGVHLGSWTLSPYLDLNITDDSNVYKDRYDEVRDMFYEPEIGLRFSSSSDTNRLTIRGNLFYSERTYDTEKNRDSTAYGDNVRLQLGTGEKGQLELIQGYRQLDDLDRHGSDIESSELAAEMVEDSNTLDLLREINQLGISAMRRMTDKLELSLSFRYAGVHYDNETHYRLDPKDLGVPEGLDLDGHILQLDGSLGLTDKTDAFLTLRQGLQKQEGIEDPAYMTTIRIGFKSQGSDKVIYNLGGGLERYERPPEVDPEAHVNFNFNASLDWFMTEKLTFRCGGYNGTQWSSFYEGNSLEYISAWAGMGYRWKPSTTFSVRGIYRKDDYLDPVTHEGVTKDRKDVRLEGHARVDYLAPGDFVWFYLELTYDSVDSNFDFVDYVDRRIIVGVKLVY